MRDGTISADMVDPAPTEQMMDIMRELDPVGLGNSEMLLRTERDFQDRLPCCKLLSYHGRCANSQLVLCLQTLLVFKRSCDNLISSDRRTCPLCVFNREAASRLKFMPTDPEMGIPVYRFAPLRMTAKNPDPLSFIQEYTSAEDVIRAEVDDVKNSAQVLTVMNPLRKFFFNQKTGK